MGVIGRLWALVLIFGLVATPAWAEALAGKASVNLDTTSLGKPVVLTITISGDLTQFRGGPAFQVPDGLHVDSQRQVTELSVGARGVVRTLNFIYVLVPTKPGAFQLGPFSIEQPGDSLLLDAVTVTVRKPRLPPFLSPEPRYTL